MHVSGAPLVSFSCFQCVGCRAELSRIKATLPLEKGYGVPYHRVNARKRIHNDCSVRNSVTRDKCSASLGKPPDASASLDISNNYPHNVIFNPHLATVKDSQILAVGN